MKRDLKQCLTPAYLRGKIKRERFRSKMKAMYAVPFIAKCIRMRGVRKVAVFPLPMNHFQPAETYVAWKVLRACGAVACAPGTRDTHLAMAWHPATQYEADESLISEYRARHPVINAGCTDIRKSRVGEVFSACFDYRLEIDPLAHRGTILRKSERNGPHDAVLLDGPLQEIESGFVYQRVIDYVTTFGMAEWRTIVVNGRVASVYVNYRPVNARFQTLPSHSEVVAVEDAFSREERERIWLFCRAMHLDFGALDILRDQNDGRMYICDCNNTPTGPSQLLSAADQLRVTSAVADAFESAYFCS